MSKGFIKFSLFAFLFIFGLLFGIESKKSSVTETEEFIEPINTTHFITRIENGQFVYEPMHPQTRTVIIPIIEKHKDNEIQEKMVAEEKSEKDSGPIMNKTGKLDQIGQTLGSKFSEITRATLEKSLSVFTD